MSELHWDVPVTQLRVGDTIVSGESDIYVELVENIPTTAEHYPGGVRVTGRLTRGTGASKRSHAWRYHHDHVMDVRR